MWTPFVAAGGFSVGRRRPFVSRRPGRRDALLSALAAWWPLDEESDGSAAVVRRDIGPYGLHLSDPANTPSFADVDPGPLYARAARFKATSSRYLTIPLSAALDPINPTLDAGSGDLTITLCAWVRPISTPATFGHYCIAAMGSHIFNSGNQGYGMLFGSGIFGGTLILTSFTSSPHNGPPQTSALTENAWSFCCARFRRFEDPTFNDYIFGAPATTESSLWPLTNIVKATTHGFFVGRLGGLDDKYFDGDISGVGIFNRRLTDEEVADLYAGWAPPE